MSKQYNYIDEIKTLFWKIFLPLSWGIIFFIGIIGLIFVVISAYEINHIYENFNYMKKNNSSFLTFLEKNQKTILMYKHKEPKNENFFMVYQLNPTQYQTALQVVYKLKTLNTISDDWNCIKPATKQQWLFPRLSKFYVTSIQDKPKSRIEQEIIRQLKDRDSFITYQSIQHIHSVENSCKNKDNFIGAFFNSDQFELALKDIGIFTPLTTKQSKRYDNEYGLFLDPQTHFLFFKTTY